MTRKEIADLARCAFESSKVAEFLSGNKDYVVPISRFVSANVPTDFGEIIRVGVFDYFNENKDNNIPKQYTTAIEQLLNGDCVSVWCAYMVCLYQVRYELRNEAPFKIISDDLIVKISSAIEQNKADLETCQLWQGRGRTRGLLQEIEATNRVLLNEYEVSLL